MRRRGFFGKGTEIEVGLVLGFMGLDTRQQAFVETVEAEDTKMYSESGVPWGIRLRAHGRLLQSGIPMADRRRTPCSGLPTPFMACSSGPRPQKRW